MTIIERIKAAIEDYNNWREDSIDKLIAVAYYVGREEATRQVSGLCSPYQQAKSPSG